MTLEEVRTALWSEIKHVLLDMDGTLLDKYFDDFFWGHLVPEQYAEKHKITVEEAKDFLYRKYKHHEGTLNWTDIDFWSDELNLDIPALKEQVRHLIEIHPHVEDFLSLLRKHKKRVILATNAHYKTIALKMRKTELGRYFDQVIASFDMGYPKEDLQFWENAQKYLGFQRETTLFIDDTEDVIETARDFGIKYIVIKDRASSREVNRRESRFLSIENFHELLPHDQ